MDDRDLLEAKYTSPSGKEFVFLWETLSKTTELKTGVFTFPDRDGAHVQHQGSGPVSFPMTCIFNGEGHVKRADDFEAALCERDIAELQHPVYGIRKVMPTGNISRDNDLIGGINESAVTITFTETITDDPVKLEAVTADKIEADFDKFKEAAAADFAESVKFENAGEKLQMNSVFKAQLSLLNENLSGMVPGPEFAVNMRELNASAKELFNKSENVVKNCLDAANLAINAIKMPRMAIIKITEKIKGYSLLIAQTINRFKNDPVGVNNVKNAFALTRLVLTAAVASAASGAALSAAEGARGGKAGTAGIGALSRETAVRSAAELNNLLSTIQNYEDAKIEKNNFIDANADAYLLLIALVQNSISLILNASFSLPMRRLVKLDRDRNFIELCAELYGSVDNFYLDKLIVENNLNIDELEIIPMGAEVAYYA